MVLDHQSEHASQWEAIRVIASQFGCSAEALRKWVRRFEVDEGQRHGTTSDEKARVRVRELRRANEILRKASAYLAQAELDRRQK